MNATIHTARTLLVGAALSVMAGCASFQGHNLQPVKSFPTPSVKKTVDVDLAFGQRFNGQKRSPYKSAEKALQKKCVKRMTKSQLFGEVSMEQQNPDIKIRIALMDYGEGSMVGAVLTGLSFYIIPSSATDTFYLKAIVIDTQTGQQHTIELNESVTLWQEILLLPLMPFKHPMYEVNKSYNMLFDNLCLEIYKTGMLAPSGE